MLEETNKLWKLADRRTGMNILICDDEGFAVALQKNKKQIENRTEK